MLKTTYVAMRDRDRLQQILHILAAEGLQDISARLARGVGISCQGEGNTAVDPPALPIRLRRAMERLGPTFIKLGQILASRSDLLAPQWTEAFSALHSNVQPLAGDMIKETITEALRETGAQPLMRWEVEPLAAASIAQVHRAWLQDGTPVIVKIQKPGLQTVIEADLRLLSHVADIAQEQWPALQRLQLPTILQQLATAMREELDFRIEAKNTKAVAANFRDDDTVAIPHIFEAYTTEKVLVQSYMDGTPLTAAVSIPAGTRKQLAASGTDAFLKMAFVHGLFHADPHPGNMFFIAPSRAGFIDFGMVGRISDARRYELMRLIYAIVDAQADVIYEVMADWSGKTPEDAAALRQALHGFIARHAHSNIKFSAAVSDFMSISRVHNMPIPPDLALLIKAIITAEGVATRLDPEIDFIAHAAPIVRAELLRQNTPDALVKDILILLPELRSTIKEIPDGLRAVLRIAQTGKIRADLSLAQIEQLGGYIERSATRIAVALVLAAFALGLAPHLIQYGPMIAGLPLFLIVGLLILIIGLLYFFSALRRNRRSPPERTG